MMRLLFLESDASQIQKTLAGDTVAFGRLVDRYIRVVHAVAYAQTGNHADAEDVAQETFLKAYLSLDTLRDPGRFGPWLVATARNKAIDVVRGRQRRHDLTDRLPRAGVVEVDLVENERHAQLRQQIMALEEGPREVILLHYFAGRSLRDIAQILQISKAAAQKRLWRARETLSENVIRALGTPESAQEFQEERKRRIMAALTGVPVAWKPATSLVASASLWTGVTVKLVAATGLVAVLAAAALFPAWKAQRQAATTRPAPVKTASERPPNPVPPVPVATPAAPVAAVEPSQSAPSVAGIEGKVIDGKGLPIGSMSVMASITERGSDGQVTKRTGMVSSATDAEGRFALAGLGAGLYELALLPPGSNVYLDKPSGKATVKEGQTEQGVVLVYDTSKGVPVFGHVRDYRGEPVSGARVSTHGRGPVYDALTDETGAFTFTRFDSGMFNIFASHPEHGSTFLTNVEAKGEEIELVLEGQGSLDGHVVAAETGEAITAFEVGVVEGEFCGADDVGRTSFAAVKDNQGHFHLDAVPLGTLTLVARAAGRATALVRPIEVAPGKTTSGIEVRIEKGTALEGQVLGAKGKPVADALVFEGRLPHTNASRYADLASTRTDAEGRFVLQGASTLTEQVAAYHPSYPAGGVVSVDWTAGRPLPVLITLDEGCVIRGVVTVGGVPRAKVKMALSFDDPNLSEKQAAMTDNAGRYEFKEVPKEVVAVRAFLPVGQGMMNDRMRMVPVELEDDGVLEVDVDFPMGQGSVAGTLAYNDQVPPHMGVGVEWTDGADARDSQRVAAQPDGSYLIENVPAGLIIFRLYREFDPHSMGMWPTTIEKTLNPGETLRQDFHLQGDDDDLEEGFWQAIVAAYPEP